MRIELRGRRVRGWVVETDVDPDPSHGALKSILKVSSEGPPDDLLELSTWAAWRWAGPRTAFLRAASPPNAVAGGTIGPPLPDLPPGLRAASPPNAVAGGTGTTSLPGIAARALRPARDSDVEAVAVRAQRLPRVLVVWPPTARMAELLRRLVSPEGSTIIVIPEVARATALCEHLESVGVATIPFHGDAGGAERTRAWVQARRGSQVVVGGRVALWAPVPDLAAVVLVDEADEALKDERTPAWHARDLALERANRAGARFTGVTPAPTLEAWSAVPDVVRPGRTTERRGWRRVVVIDRREEPPGSGMFSPELVEYLRRADDRVVCVLNRKGRARLLACGACGQMVTCDACGGPTAEDDRGLVCRVCGESRPRLCAQCASTSLARLKPGISRLREELSALLPRIEVVEIDASSDRAVDAVALIGTEAALHRVKGASVVAFLDFDQELLAPRFRAAEQAMWLIVRALRITAGVRGASVVIQTRLPDHAVVRAARDGEPDILAMSERERRIALGLPPFGALAHVEANADVIGSLAAALGRADGVGFDGPIPGPGQRMTGLVRAAGVATLCNALAVALPLARAQGRIRVDVDPLRI